MKRVYSQSREADYAVTVDWNLGNTCSLGCSYCHRWFNAGTNPFPDLEKARLIVDRIAEKHRSSNRPVRFSFTGGEPTEWSDLPLLCQHVKESAWYRVHIATNGVADMSVWRDLAPWLDSVQITHHGTDIAHTLEVACYLVSQYRAVTVALPLLPGRLAETLSDLDLLARNGISAYPQPLYADHALRRRPLDYSAAEIAFLFPKSDDFVVEDDGKTETTSSEAVIFQHRNSFTGMKCGIGIDQIVIDQDGTIRGGWCRVGGALGNVHLGDFLIPETALTCTKPTCDNPSDLTVPKWTD